MHGLPLAQEDKITQPDAASRRSPRLLRHRRRTHARQIGFGDIRVLFIELLGDHDGEDRVAQELQTLVVGDSPGLIRVAAMDQGKLEECWFDARPPCLNEGIGIGAGRNRKVLRAAHQDRSGSGESPSREAREARRGSTTKCS